MNVEATYLKRVNLYKCVNVLLSLSKSEQYGMLAKLNDTSIHKKLQEHFTITNCLICCQIISIIIMIDLLTVNEYMKMR